MCLGTWKRKTEEGEKSKLCSLLFTVPLVRDSKQCLRNFLDLLLCVSLGLSSPAKPCLNPLWCAANRLNLPRNGFLDVFILSFFSLLFLSSLESLSYCFICIWSKNKIKSPPLPSGFSSGSVEWQASEGRLYMNQRFIRNLIEIGSGGHEVNVAGKHWPRNQDW